MANDSVAVEELTTSSAPVELTTRPPARGGAVSFERRWLGGLHPAYLALLAFLLVFPSLNLGSYSISLVTQILVFSIFTMSLDLLLGYVGLPSFGHAAFLGIGAYSAAVFSAKLGIS